MKFSLSKLNPLPSYLMTYIYLCFNLELFYNMVIGMESYF